MDFDWQGLLVYMCIGAASALLAKRLQIWWKARNASKKDCGDGCGCSK